jgi:mono/diheme cytochrome c family protein
MSIKFRTIVVTALLLSALTTFWGCDYARMNEQEALQTYREQLPEMPENSVPMTGGLQTLRKADPEKMRNPLPFNTASIQQGREGYGHHCIMCHGPRADGNGTVGQSFYPLPTDLRRSPVQQQSDGRLFFTLTFGFKRHPALGFMLTEQDRWAIICYLRSLKKD